MNIKFNSIKTRLQFTTGSILQSQHLISRQIGYRKFFAVVIILVITTLFLPLYSFAFSLFAHDAIVDIEWEKSIKPLLKIKYPKTSDSAMQAAHAYIYGGAIIADIGYYSSDGVFFTNLVHYVRTGDFINALLDEAKDLNEYAFALGALSHYYGDKYGHSMCINRSVPMLFPELKQKYGDIVTFEQDEKPHARVEFGIDVIQTALGNYAPQSYHDFIGFQVSQPVLERAFLKTYKIEINSIFTSLPMAITVLRFTIKEIFPELTKDAWRIRQSIITKLNPLADKDNYEYNIDNDTYEKEFGKIPIKSTIISFIIGLFPKFGPLEGYRFIEASPEVEKLFKKAKKTILIHYSSHLKRLAHKRPHLDNINFDTGKKSAPNEYKATDETYEKLLEKQKK